MAGKLYLVPTPIGNLGDISRRAAETLEGADFIAAEDTRVTVKLLNHLELKKPMVAYHRHNCDAAGPSILRRLEAGGCLTVYAVEHNGRLRKFYRITSGGVRQIDQFLEGWPEILRVYDFIKECAEHDTCAVSQ